MTASASIDFRSFVDALVRLSEVDGALRRGVVEDRPELEERRRALLTELPADVVNVHDRLLKNGRWPTIVAAKDGYCTGCHLRLTAEVVNGIVRRNEAIRCQHCQRILY